MRSMKMAALAVAMTLMFSGLALARDHDRRTKTSMIAGTSMAIVTVTMIAIVTAIMTEWRDHDHWGDARTRPGPRARPVGTRPHRNDGYYGGGQIYNRYPRGYPGGYGYPSGGYGYPSGGYGYPAAVTAIPVAATAVAETAATTSAIRTAATWRAGHGAEQTVQSQSAQ